MGDYREPQSPLFKTPETENQLVTLDPFPTELG